MPFDNSLILRDGVYDLDSDEDATPVIVTAADAHGSKALDIKKSGATGLVATMICPTAPSTGYGDLLTVEIQEADYYDDDDAYKTVATFPILYNHMLRVEGVVTTPFASDDIAQTLTASGTGTDTGTIRYFDPDMDTVGYTGWIYVAMVASNDTYANIDDTLTSGGGGIATLTTIGEVTDLLSYGVYEVRFVLRKRYVRAKVVADATSNWGKVKIFLTDAGYGGLI